MQKMKVVELGNGKSVTIKELQVEPIIKLVEDIMEGKISLKNQTKIVFELMKESTSLSIEEFRKLYFSEISMIEKEFKEVNKDFFRYWDLATSLWNWAYKNMNVEEFVKKVLKEFMSEITKTFDKINPNSSLSPETQGKEQKTLELEKRQETEMESSKS